MNLRIKSIIWNIRKHKTTYQKTRIKNPKKEDSISSLWDNFKKSNIGIIGMLEGEEKEQEIRNLLEKIMKEKSLNLVKEIDMQDQEAYRVPNKTDANRPMPRYIIIEMSKVR